MHRVERVTGNGIDSLSDAIPREDTVVFGDTAWLRAWEQAFLPSRGWCGPLVAYALRDGATTVGWIALARQRIRGMHVASLAGYYWPFRTTALCDGPSGIQAATEFADHFARRPPHAVVRLGPVSVRDAGTMALIDAMYASGWRALACDSGEVFELPLPGGDDGIHATMSSSLLKNIRYLRRKLEKERGPVVAQRHVLSAQTLPVLTELEAIEACSWVAAKGGETKFMGGANREFWSRLAHAPARASQVVCWVLHCADTPLAFSVHVETASRVFIIANNYREDDKSYSPGSILSLEVLTDACGRGKHHVDWGQGDSGYKSRWGARPTSRLRDVLLFRPGMLGGAMFAAARRALPSWQLV